MKVQKLIKARIEKVLAGIGASDTENSLDLSKLDPIHMAKGVGIMLLSGLFGSSAAAFSSYPFGIAFLAVTDKYVVYSYLGLIASALANRGYSLALALVYTVVLMLRYAIGRLLCAAESETPKMKKARIFSRFKRKISFSAATQKPFGENLLIRCAVGCFAAFVFGLYRLISGGFLYYDLFGLLAGFIITPLTVVAISGVFYEHRRFSGAAELSPFVLMFLFVYSLREYTVFGFSPGFMAALFITFVMASARGSFRGCAMGLFAGLACSSINIYGGGEAYALTYTIGAAPCIMAVAGLVSGWLWRISRISALACSAAAALMLGLCVDGYDVLSRIIPDVCVTVAVFAPLAHYGLLPKLPIFVGEGDNAADFLSPVLERKQNDFAARMNALSDAFAHLSETVYSLSDRMRRPGAVDLKAVCDDTFDSYCKKCAISQICWDRECSSTLDAQSKITAELYTKGRIGFEDIPDYLRSRCPNTELIIDDINASCGKLIERLIKNDKTEAFALDYEAMSKLLSEQIACGEAEYKIDEERTKNLRKTLKHMGFNPERAICYGSRRKRVVVGDVELARVKMGADEIRSAVENTLEIPMGAPHFNIEGDTVTMTLDARRCFCAEVAKASSVKEYESANGDSAASFESREDRFYALISDGMGSGKEAAVTSKICTVFLERMLRAGNGKAVTLEMLNGFIKSRGTECSATVDLAEIDLITGEACFIKSGAAPSFVLRGGNLYKLQSKTAPIGIMSEPDAEKIKFELCRGDVIVMLSDGVAQSLEDGIWLANLLTYEWEDHLGTMAEKILDNAAINNKRSDDMTAVLIRICEATAD